MATAATTTTGAGNTSTTQHQQQQQPHQRQHDQLHDHHQLNFLHDSSGDWKQRVARPSSTSKQHPYALLVMNAEVGDFLPELWRHAAVRVCVDGGVNRVFDALPSSHVDVPPDLIIGDFDSARNDVLSHYRTYSQRLTRIIHDQDQDSTDMDKALSYLYRHFSGFTQTIIYGSFGGRLDQQISSLRALKQYTERQREQQILLLAEGNLCEYLLAGSHTIRLNPYYEKQGQHAGLFNIEKPVNRITTTGLTWNLSQNIEEDRNKRSRHTDCEKRPEHS